MRIQQNIWKDNAWVEKKYGKDMNLAQLVLLFGETDMMSNTSYLEDVRSLYPEAIIAGCSTAGEILSTNIYNNSIVLSAIEFEKTHVRSAMMSIEGMKNSFAIGAYLVRELLSDDLQHIFVLSDGLHVNGSDLVKGMNSELPLGVAVTGGLAGDQGRFQKTNLIYNNRIGQNMVIAIGFYGDSISVSYGSMGGWDAFGPERIVTKAEGNILYEIDGKSALSLYRDYLGAKADGLPATGLLFPLDVFIEDDNVHLVRTLLSIDKKTQGMIFAGDIPEGSKIQLMKANFDRLIDGAAGAARMSYQSLGEEKPEFSILISCVGRKLILKQRSEEEVEHVVDILGSESAISGFYSYGEICPVIPHTNICELHNQTMTITSFIEK